ncbi:squamosa promoter-binding-like protein 2 [Medicago truncatula]|uniref:squamosa promoter-binding-like protein 2 n=1 Tax=Medicago truncatula TaxID=3880 RepID=UPI000D2F2E22|nr:squamosa promoter-binding-like protein 2 [Medicago truncatula]
MDLNAISPSSQWEWDHLPLLDTKATENQKLQPPNWTMELDPEINFGLYDTPVGSGSSGSDLIHGSAFNAPKFSCVSGEPLLNPRLGKRMYFEEVCPESDSKNLSFSRDLMSSLILEKKCKSNGQNLQCPPHCQVEGCGLNLSSAKDYHCKRRVCESHAKSPMVVIDGLERRFCQQCSRFHDLFEFDGKKKSCRRQLSNHNARRRKYHRQAVQSSQSALSYSRSDGKQQMSPFTNSKTATNLAWQNMHNSKLPQAKDFLLKPSKDNIDTPSVEDFMNFSDTNATQDFTCALSLLSTNQWDSYATKSISQEHSNRPTSPFQATTHAMSQCIPLASSEPCCGHHDQYVNSNIWISNSADSNHFQKFQLFREPYEL